MKDDKFTISLSKDEVDLLREVLDGVLEQSFEIFGRDPKDFKNNKKAKSTFSLYIKIEKLCK